jgi:hypothetical protein
MNAHQFLVETHLGSEDGIYAYGTRDAIRDGLRSTVASLGRPLTFEGRSKEGNQPHNYFGYIGRGYREVFLSFNPPGSYTLEKDVAGVSGRPDPAKDWCVYCDTDVRIFDDLPKERYVGLYEPAILMRDLTLAGLTCVLQSGRAPGRADAASIPRESVVLIDAPEDWIYSGEHIGAWADILGPKLSVRHGPNLKSYNSICGPVTMRRNAAERARDLEEIRWLLQEIAVATSANTPLLP